MPIFRHALLRLLLLLLLRRRRPGMSGGARRWMCLYGYVQDC
jgi:hypothetical protein